MPDTTPDAPAKKSVCAYPWQQMIVDLTGEVVPCCFWSGYANSGKPLGNTNVNTIAEIWNGPGYQDLRRRITEDDPSFPCHQCMASQWSGGQYPQFQWPSNFVSLGGHAYSCSLLQSFVTATEGSTASWVLLEDGREIGPLVDSVEEITRRGGGRFRVTDTHLYMSASDNSAPTANGRRYELRRGGQTWTVRTTDVESTSGRNLQTAYEEYTSQQTTLSAKPTLLSFISTSDCNIDCGMCSQNKVRKFKVQHREGTQQEVLALTPYLTQFTWQGGEPFLIEDFRRFYSDFQPADNPNLTFGFTSNGTMVSEKVVEQLLKFPRLNATISMDSFSRESFERIRGGARFDVVRRNVEGLMRHYDLPDRLFVIAGVVMKSNLLELPETLRYAVDQDLPFRFGPMVVYPVHERLDIFQDFAAQTAGWDEALQEARRVAEDGWARPMRVRRAHQLDGMVDAIRSIYDEARQRYAQTSPLVIHVEDPTGSLAHMKLPGVVFYRRNMPSRPLGYAVFNGPGTYVVQAPTPELNVYDHPYGHFYHDLHDETDVIGTIKLKPIGHRRFAEMRLVVAPFEQRVFIRNLRRSNAGRPRPDGLIVTDPALQL